MSVPNLSKFSQVDVCAKFEINSLTLYISLITVLVHERGGGVGVYSTNNTCEGSTSAEDKMIVQKRVTSDRPDCPAAAEELIRLQPVQHKHS